MGSNNRFLYGWKLYVHYGQGWEYELFETSWKEVKDRLKEYRENCPQYPIKARRGREVNPDYNPTGVEA